MAWMHKGVCRFNFNNKVRVKLQRKEIISLYQLKINYRSTLDVLSLNFIVDSRNISTEGIIPPVSFETRWRDFYWGRMKSLWELRWLSLLLFMTHSWLLCDKRGRGHNGCSPHHVTARRRVTLCLFIFSTITSSFTESNYSYKMEIIYI